MKNLYLITTNIKKYLVVANDKENATTAMLNEQMEFGEWFEHVEFVCVTEGDFTEGQVLKTIE